MKQKGNAVIIILLFLAVVGLGVNIYLMLKKDDERIAIVAIPTSTPVLEDKADLQTNPVNSGKPVATPVVTSLPTQLEPVNSAPEGWLRYENEEYGFEIFYPEDYQALDSAEHLYGWPDAVVLFYGGGQSYDLPVEVWDSVADYEAKYQNQLSDLVVKKVGSKYVTMINVNKEATVDEIMETFKVTE